MAKVKKPDPYIWGTGRRKTSVARVRLKESGSGKFLVNKKEMTDFFCNIDERQRVLAPLKAADVEKTYDVFVTTLGGGVTGQSGAIALGIARALLKANPELEPSLREGRYLTRDSRQKERKKYGRRGARRGFQFSKR